MTIPKPKMLYYAGAGMQLDGNKVEKWHDIAREYGEIPAAGDDQTFAGADRPELMQGWDNENHKPGAFQVAAESKTPNLIQLSNELGGVAGGNWIKTVGYADSPFGDANEAVRVQMNTEATGNDNWINLSSDTNYLIPAGTKVTFSIFAKKLAGASGSPRVRIWFVDTDNNIIADISIHLTLEINKWTLVKSTITMPEDGTIRQFVERIQDGTSSADWDILFWGGQIELNAYPTNRIHTNGSVVTRLAPEPVITGFLPVDKATIAGWCDVVYSPDNATRIFDSAGALSTHRSLLGIELDAGNLSVLAQIFGSDGGQIIELLPFAVNDYQRIRFGYAISYNANTLTLWLVGHDGAAYKFSINHDINDTTETDIFTGARLATLQTSTRHEVAPGIHAYTDSDQVVKNLLSALSRYEGGANLSPEQIVIQ